MEVKEKDFVNEFVEVVFNEKCDGSDAVKSSPNIMVISPSPGDDQPCQFKNKSLSTKLTNRMPNNSLDQISSFNPLLSNPLKKTNLA